MKTITDQKLLKIAEKWNITAPVFISKKNAFIQGYRLAESKALNMHVVGVQSEQLRCKKCDSSNVYETIVCVPCKLRNGY